MKRLTPIKMLLFSGTTASGGTTPLPRLKDLAPHRHEDDEQRDIIELTRLLGGEWYENGRPRSQRPCKVCGAKPQDLGMRATPGFPDLTLFLPDRVDGVKAPLRGAMVLLFWETKSDTGRLAPAQSQFQRRCARARVAHGTGTARDFRARLILLGYAEGSADLRDFRLKAR